MHLVGEKAAAHGEMVGCLLVPVGNANQQMSVGEYRVQCCQPPPCFVPAQRLSCMRNKVGQGLMELIEVDRITGLRVSGVDPGEHGPGVSLELLRGDRGVRRVAGSGLRTADDQ